MSAGDDLVDRIVGTIPTKRNSNRRIESIVASEKAKSLTSEAKQKLNTDFISKHPNLIGAVNNTIIKAANSGLTNCYYYWNSSYNEELAKNLIHILHELRYQVYSYGKESIQISW